MNPFRGAVPALLFLLVMAGAGRSWSDESPPAAIVAYGRGYAVVREHARLKLEPGWNSAWINRLPARIRPDSIIPDGFGKGIRLAGQRFVPRVSESFLLREHEGKTVMFEIIDPSEGRWTAEGKILRAGQDPVVEFDGRIIFGLPGRPMFDSPGKRNPMESAAVWDIHSENEAEFHHGFSYITDGISWQALYSASFTEDSDFIELNGRFLIRNDSGKRYPEAAVKLLAGEVAETGEIRPALRAMERADFGLAAPPVGPPAAIGEYYLYPLSDPVTLEEGETSTVEFLNAGSVKTRTKYVFEAAAGPSVRAMVEFENTAENSVGVPLPGGRVRLYRREGRFAVFMGEDSIGHTPVREKISLNTGGVFDIKAERKQTDSKPLAPREREESYEITLRNRKEEAAEVRVRERLGQRFWNISEYSDEFEKIDAQTVEFILKVPAGEERKLTYTVRLSW